MTENELIVKCRKNDKIAQELLYRRYNNKMYGVCLRYGKNVEEAQDILQEGFVKIFSNLDKYEGRGSFEGWMRRIIINTAINHLRSKVNQFYSVEIDDYSAQMGMNEEASSKIETEYLLSLVQELPEGYKMVFNMFAIEGYSHKEIAEKLKISVSTSKSQLNRARAVLQNKLKKKNLLDNYEKSA